MNATLTTTGYTIDLTTGRIARVHLTPYTPQLVAFLTPLTGERFHLTTPTPLPGLPPAPALKEM